MTLLSRNIRDKTMLKQADEWHLQLFETRDIYLSLIWEIKLYTPNKDSGM